MDPNTELALAADELEDCAFIIGVDEAGRGPLAGPVAVAAVCTRTCGKRDAPFHPKLNDSKLMKEADRDSVCGALLAPFGTSATSIQEQLSEGKVATYATSTGGPVLGFAAAFEGRDRIDAINILNASLEGMGRCINSLLSNPALRDAGVTRHNTVVLIDGNHLPWCLLTDDNRQKKLSKRKSRSQQKEQFTGQCYESLVGFRAKCIVGGDRKCQSIAAASVIAKVTRDMFATHTMDPAEPLFEFRAHKGYPTPRHLELLARFGPGQFHRKTYKPVCKAAAPHMKGKSRSTKKKTAKKSVQVLAKRKRPANSSTNTRSR
jgi:ribonuclease HII